MNYYNGFKFYSSHSTILTPDNCLSFYNLVTPPENLEVVFQWSHLRKYYVNKDYSALPRSGLKYHKDYIPTGVDYVEDYICKDLTHFVMLFKTTEGNVFGVYINRAELRDNKPYKRKTDKKQTIPPNETPSFIFSLNRNEILNLTKFCPTNRHFGVNCHLTDDCGLDNLLIFKLLKHNTFKHKDNTQLRGSIHFTFPMVKCNGQVLYNIFNRQYKYYRTHQRVSIKMTYEEVEIYDVKVSLTKNVVNFNESN